jgi:hypothetical protein
LKEVAVTLEGRDGLLRHTVDDPTVLADTQYYAALSTGPANTPAFVGDPIHFKTHPHPSAGFTMKIAVGSCQGWALDPGPEKSICWPDILAWEPDKLWDIGDFHYEGAYPDQFTHEGETISSWRVWARMYWAQLDLLPEMRKARARVVEDQLGDDHDFSKNDGDSFDSPYRKAHITAMTRVFPLVPGPDNAAGKGLWATYQINDRVRVILLDGQSLERSVGDDPDEPGDPPAKTFLGATQDAWLTEILLQPMTLNLVVCGKSWIGDESHNNKCTGDPYYNCSNDRDKIWNYSAWRRWFANWVVTHRTVDNPINMVWIGGDRHAAGYAPRQDSDPLRPFPTYLSSGWHQGRLEIHAGEEVYAPRVGFRESGKVGKVSPAVQYVRLYLKDDPVRREVLLTGQIRHRIVKDRWETILHPVMHDFWSYVG